MHPGYLCIQVSAWIAVESWPSEWSEAIGSHQSSQAPTTLGISWNWTTLDHTGKQIKIIKQYQTIANNIKHTFQVFAFRFHHCCFLLFPASLLVFTRYMKSRKLYFLRIYTSTYGTFGFAVRSRWDWLVLLVDEKGVKGYISEDAAHFQSCCYTWAQPTHEHSPGLNAYTAYTFYPIFWDKFLDFLAQKAVFHRFRFQFRWVFPKDPRPLWVGSGTRFPSHWPFGVQRSAALG